MKRIFDLIAVLCSRVVNSCPDGSLFVRYSCISTAARETMQHRLFQNLPFLFEKTAQGMLTVRQFTEERQTPYRLDCLETYMETLSQQEEAFAMIYLLQILDAALETLLLDIIREYQREDFSVVLNTNREITGIGLLPRTSCVWERKHRLFHSYNRLDNFLTHLLLLDHHILGELIDKHYFLKQELFPHFAATKSIKVAVSPLRLERCFEVIADEKNMVQYFHVQYTGEDFRTENERLWQKILAAARNESDMVVFPEMLGNPAMQEDISQRLKRLNERERRKMPSLIFLPSVWDNHQNTVIILDKNGDTVCKQTKQNPFRDEVNGTGYLEDIRTNMVVNILHYEGIGRIAVLVCKDFITTAYMEQLMRCFRLTLIIVPSFSTGSYDFRQSFDLCAHDDCNVVWINTCAALQKGKEANFENIGYVRKRIGRNDDDSQKLCEMPICQGAFEGRCSHECLFIETIRGV